MCAGGHVASAFNALQHGAKFVTAIDAVIVMVVPSVGFGGGHSVV